MHYVIAVILAFVIYGSFQLSLKDFRKKNICPKIIGIPACYLVLAFFAGALVLHLIGPQLVYWYYGFIGVPFILALMGTLTEVSGKVVCPRTSGGTPMCFISLGFCTTLIVLKFFSF
ncbi:hypothetical protein [Neolewinella persica]|uniref:hypothetical protein n=1 Tax=Neolewinella persica TaxID=70998 RepID=UPI0003804A06|nr:hypothetical protein [Neolewinella persica]